MKRSAWGDYTWPKPGIGRAHVVSNGIKAAQIQAKNSSLNSSWGAGALPTQNVFSVIRNAVVRNNLNQQGRKQSTGRHAGPAKGNTSANRHVPKHAAF